MYAIRSYYAFGVGVAGHGVGMVLHGRGLADEERVELADAPVVRLGDELHEETDPLGRAAELLQGVGAGGRRITSYNVCYTKLLRDPAAPARSVRETASSSGTGPA